MPIITSRGSRPLVVLFPSVAGAASSRLALWAIGSGRSSTCTAFASAISSSVPWRMKIGLPRHIAVIACPTLRSERSTSVVASDSADWSGFI